MPNTYALIIGIESYVKGGLGKVHHAKADAKAFKEAIAKLGVEEQNIEILLNKKATRGQIEYKLHSLSGIAEEDDRLIIYYAGHGVSIKSTNYLTSYESRHDFLEKSSIPIDEVFTTLRSSKCQKIILFLDACHSESIAQECLRKSTEALSLELIRDAIENSEHLVCFSSCSTGESSHSSHALKHGIWTHHLLSAITNPTHPFVKDDGGLLGSSLQNWLAAQVPATVKKEINSRTRQTPKMYGSMSSDFEVFNLTPLKQAQEPAPTTTYELQLIREYTDHVQHLSGWKSGHFVADRQTDSTLSFLYQIADVELKGVAEEWTQKLKSIFHLKLREHELSNIESGYSVYTPMFHVDAYVEYASDDCSEFIITHILHEITDFEKLSDSAFEESFTGEFNTCRYRLKSSLNMLEALEALENADYSPDYPSDHSHAMIECYTDATVIIRPNLIDVIHRNDQTPIQMIENSKAILDEIAQDLNFKLNLSD